MLVRLLLVGLLALGVTPWLACRPDPGPPEQVLAHYPAEDLEGVISRGLVAVDTGIRADGAGSLRIEVSEPTTVLLWVANLMPLDDATLFYRAKLRSRGLEGRAFLEMWAHVPGHGEAFSRGLKSAISGDTEWTPQETPFRVGAGQQPDYVKLNLTIEGAGTVWIDDVRLVAAPRS